MQSHVNKEAGHSFSVKMITGLKIIGEVGIFCESVSFHMEAPSTSVAWSLTSARSQPLLLLMVLNGRVSDLYFSLLDEKSTFFLHFSPLPSSDHCLRWEKQRNKAAIECSLPVPLNGQCALTVTEGSFETNNKSIFSVEEHKAHRSKKL